MGGGGKREPRWSQLQAPSHLLQLLSKCRDRTQMSELPTLLQPHSLPRARREPRHPGSPASLLSPTRPHFPSWYRGTTQVPAAVPTTIPSCPTHLLLSHQIPALPKEDPDPTGAALPGPVPVSCRGEGGSGSSWHWGVGPHCPPPTSLMPPSHCYVTGGW